MYDAGVERALVVALEAHQAQVRKNSGAPYVVHPLHIALFLARLDQPSEVVQAGLLHDVVEDSEDWTVAGVRAEFGVEVAAIVAELTEDKRLTWGERKRAAVAKVPGLSPGGLVVKACDVLHNLESLVRALEEASDAEEVWSSFRGGRDRTLEMSGRMVAALGERLEGPLRQALQRVRARLGSL